jgi:hypothetical protein
MQLGITHLLACTWPPLWSSGQSSWLQIFRVVVGLERGPHSLVRPTEELLERKSSGSSLGSREYCRRNSSLWPRNILCQQKLAVTSPTNGGRSVDIVRSRTQATEFSF